MLDAMASMRGVREGGKEESCQSQDCDRDCVRRKVRNGWVGCEGGDTVGWGGRGSGDCGCGWGGGRVVSGEEAVGMMVAECVEEGGPDGDVGDVRGRWWPTKR